LDELQETKKEREEGIEYRKKAQPALFRLRTSLDMNLFLRSFSTLVDPQHTFPILKLLISEEAEVNFLSLSFLFFLSFLLRSFSTLVDPQHTFPILKLLISEEAEVNFLLISLFSYSFLFLLFSFFFFSFLFSLFFCDHFPLLLMLFLFSTF
jgi:hypothetical protein